MATAGCVADPLIDDGDLVAQRRTGDKQRFQDGRQCGVAGDRVPHLDIPLRAQRGGQLDTRAAQETAHAVLDVLKPTYQSGACSQQSAVLSASMLLTCTGRNQPMRRRSAMPRASLRSILAMRADRAART